jgi:hypothetical protein
MAIQTTAEKNSLAAKYAADALYGALFTTAPSGGTAGTEVTGGTPAYARKALSWSAPSNGVITASATFDVPACTVVGTGVYSAATAGTYLDGNTVSSVTFPTQDTVTVTFTFTQS